MEGRITRARQAEARADIERIDADGPPRSGPLSAVTVQDKAYPGKAAVFYAVQALDVDGPEVEGGDATLTAIGPVFYAANVGAAVPPVGTHLVIHPVPSGRWAFRY